MMQRFKVGYDQREGIYPKVIGSGMAKTEQQAEKDAAKFCRDKYARDTKKVNREYEWKP